MDKIDLNSLFLGPKSENEKFFKDMLTFLINDHIGWRKYFHPEDKPLGNQSPEELKAREITLDRVRESLLELAANLQTSSVPWFSPRYLGHMATDIMMPALLGYMLTLLYNPNNCAYEASPATTPMEIEIGKQLAVMMGFDQKKAWGHITSGGTIANYEGLWAARNLRSIPFAIKKVSPQLLPDLSNWELANLPKDQILDLLQELKNMGLFDKVRSESAGGVGMAEINLGKWLVPQSKHYSWAKGADILGIGKKNLVHIKVKNNYRLDIYDLKKKIDYFISIKQPILGVVAVLGSTEEGAVDELDKLVELRREYSKQNVWFYIHVDAAYGGYVRTAFLGPSFEILDYDQVINHFRTDKSFNYQVEWPSIETYNAFKATSEVDSITVDPHKLGYVPYSAGAVMFSDKRILDTISYFAAYVFDKEEKNPLLLGSYIMEGSKAGATVASVWTAHRVVPLNINGYGKLIRNSIEGAHRFYNSLLSNSVIKIDNAEIKLSCLCKPDLNIIIYAFNKKGNKSLSKMNEFNQKIYDALSYRSGPLYATDYIVSKTSLSIEEYDDVPYGLVSSLGISFDEWRSNRDVFVLRSCILTPLLAQENYAEYWNVYINSLKNKLKNILSTINF